MLDISLIISVRRTKLSSFAKSGDRMLLMNIQSRFRPAFLIVAVGDQPLFLTPFRSV